MNLLVIGNGGREHAIAKKLLTDERVKKVYCAPGNPGMIADGIEPIDIAADDSVRLISFAKAHAIHWTFVGPEQPLLAGIVDAFQAEDLRIFGPSKGAALIEGSKDFAKQLMIEQGIPTAKYRTFTDFDAAKMYVSQQTFPLVLKADGLAAGKGVVIAEDLATAIATLEEMLLHHKFGESSAKVVIEEFLVGEEFSYLAFVNGEKVYPMVIAQDHKRAFDGDKGPNTGGMGVYSPVPQIPQTTVDTAYQRVLLPAARGMVERGTPFTGILYAGLIATVDGPKVIEFNARFGDPETQVILPRLTSSLTQIIDDLLFEREPTLTWSEQTALGVVVAAQGYPATYETGMRVPRLSSGAHCQIDYAGVTVEREELVANGGRVLLVSAVADTLALAQTQVYETLAELPLEKMFYRHDIGNKGL